MKFRTTILLAVALLAIFSMSSCVKNYTCHCVFSYTGYSGLPDTSFDEYNITDKKDGAKSKCTGQSGEYNNNGIKTVETCTLN